MKTNVIENETNAEGQQAAPEKPAPAKAAAKKAARSPKKAAKAKKSTRIAKSAPKAKGKRAGAREGSKTSQVLELLKRPGGATLREIMKVTGWQAHSVRGFISGTLGKKMDLAVQSEKGENGERTYRLGR